MTTEVRLESYDYKNNKVEVKINETEFAIWEARLASILIERWGVIATVPDGEDSSGRSKMRKTTPEELVNEACETAKLAVAKFRELGWVAQLPTFAERDAFLKIVDKK